MTEPRHATYHYAIDPSDRIVSVSNTWLEFARENGASELSRACVVGQPLWRFVRGESTRRIYELLFSWVREQGVQLQLPFRCDSPDLLRFMRLHLAPGRDGVVELAAVLERVKVRPRMRVLDRLVPRSEASFPICSMCRRIFAFGEWLELDDAVARLGWLETELQPGLEEDVCLDCSSRARAALSGAPPV